MTEPDNQWLKVLKCGVLFLFEKFHFILPIIIFLYFFSIIPSIASIATASLKAGLSTKEKYDDNLLLVKENREDDLIHSTGVILRLENSNYYFQSYFNHHIESQIYQKNHKLNHVRHNSYFQLKVMPTPSIFFDVTNHFKYLEEYNLIKYSENFDLEDISSAELIRQKKTLNDFYMRMNKKLTGRSSIFLDYEYYLEDAEDIWEADEDISSFKIGFDYLYGRMNKNKCNLWFESKYYSFQENDPKRKKRGFSTYSLITEYIFDISYRSELKPYGGIVKTEDNNRDSLFNENYFFEAGIVYKVNLNHLTINYSYDHAISGKGEFGELVVKDRYILEGTWYFNPTLSTTVSSNYIKNNYSDSNIFGSQKDNKALMLYIDLQYHKKDKFKTTFSYYHFKNDYLNPKEAGTSDYKQSSLALKTDFFISKSLKLKIEYTFTGRDSIEDNINVNNISFKRNLISIGLIIGNIDF